MAAVSVFEDITADHNLDDFLHSMFNIEYKLQDSHAEIKSTDQQSSINSFSKQLFDKAAINFEHILLLLSFSSLFVYIHSLFDIK